MQWICRVIRNDHCFSGTCQPVNADPAVDWVQANSIVTERSEKPIWQASARWRRPGRRRRFCPAKTIAAILGLPVADIDERYPIQEVSTGLPFFIVPLKTLSALQSARVDRNKYFAFIKDSWAKGILIFCPQAHETQNHISVRVFVDYFGVPEDPATGSGNGCLAGYLVEHRYFGKDSIDIRSEQGYEIGRPSLLLLQAEQRAAGIGIKVGGKAVIVAQGEFI